MRRIGYLIVLLPGFAFAAEGLAEDSVGGKSFKHTIEFQLAQSRSDNDSGLEPRYQEKLERDRQLRRQRDSSSQAVEQQTTRTTAQGEFVRCPVNKLRTEVVTDLPSPWWQTPQIGGLEDTRIQNIGGEITLVCAYRGYGGTVSVMREAPSGTECRARADGFSCY